MVFRAFKRLIGALRGGDAGPTRDGKVGRNDAVQVGELPEACLRGLKEVGWLTKEKAIAGTAFRPDNRTAKTREDSRHELSINWESIVYLDYNALRTDYHRVDRVFLRRIITFWPREKALFRSLPESEKMTDRDWESLATVPIENIPASIRESSLESLSFQVSEFNRWLMHHISIEWLVHWWKRRAGSYGYDPSLSADVEARCVELIQEWKEEIPGRPKKSDIKAKAHSILGNHLSGRAFDRAWAKAAPKDWKRPGRRTSAFFHSN